MRLSVTGAWGRAAADDSYAYALLQSAAMTGCTAAAAKARCPQLHLTEIDGTSGISTDVDVSAKSASLISRLTGNVRFRPYIGTLDDFIGT